MLIIMLLNITHSWSVSRKSLCVELETTNQVIAKNQSTLLHGAGSVTLLSHFVRTEPPNAHYQSCTQKALGLTVGDSCV